MNEGQALNIWKMTQRPDARAHVPRGKRYDSDMYHIMKKLPRIRMGWLLEKVNPLTNIPIHIVRTDQGQCRCREWACWETQLTRPVKTSVVVNNPRLMSNQCRVVYYIQTLKDMVLSPTYRMPITPVMAWLESRPRLKNVSIHLMGIVSTRQRMINARKV